MNTALIRERDVTVDGIRTVLREAGPKDASEAVVFCHGNPGPSEDWIGLIGRVGLFARAVAWDAPGFGRADKPTKFPHTVEGHAAFIGSVVDELGIDRVHLVVHDFGAWGLEWAATHPDRFASAVIINSGVLIGYRWHWMARVWQTPLLGELFMATSSRAGIRLIMGKTDPKLTRGQVDRIYNAMSDPATKRAVLRLYRASKRTAFAAWAEHTAARLRPLDRPALVAWGADDRFVPVRYAEGNRSAFPRAEVATIDGSGHWPFLDNSRLVEDIVCKFLQPLL